MGFNQKNCADNERNVGFGGCVVDFKAIKGLFLVPKNKVYTQAEFDDLRKTLTDGTMASKKDRIYPIHGFETPTDNTEDPTEWVAASGRPEVTNESSYKWMFQFLDGRLCLSNALRSFNESDSFAYIFYDKKNMLIATTKLDATGQKGYAGIPKELFYAYPWKMNDYSNPSAYRIKVAFRPEYINELIAFKQSPFPLTEIVGLQNIVLTSVTAGAAGVYKIQASTGCDGQNLFELYQAELAAAALWTATNASTGAAITITSVAADANLKTFTVTLSTADPDYPAAGNIIISLVSASALDVAGISPFEGIPVVVARS